MIKAHIDKRLIEMLLEKGYIFRARKGVFLGLDKELSGELIITEEDIN